MSSDSTWIISVLLFNFSFLLAQKSTDSSEYVTLEIPEFIQNSPSCNFPVKFDLTIKFQNGNKTSLELSMNSDLHVNGPLYVVRKTKTGANILVQEALQDIKDVAFYQDIQKEASMMMKCSMGPNTGKTIQVTGTYTNGDSQYSLDIEENQTDNTILSDTYTVREKTADLTVSHDYRHLPNTSPTEILQESFSLDPQRSIGINRAKRASYQQIYVVDLLVVVDYQIYMDWYQKDLEFTGFGQDEDVKNNLRRYFSHFINEIDIRYKSIISADLKMSVSIAGFIVADRPETYPWIEIRRETAEPRDYVNADDALKDFRFWIRNARGLPPHDHAMLFTGVDLYSSDGNAKLLHTAGLAFIGSMCRSNGDSVSVVEDHGGLQNIGTASHELGHSLGALHDGEDNECSSNNRYIMASSGYGPIPPEKRLNQWQFSSCSVNYFREFINNLTRTGYSCLTERYDDLGTESSEVPGQLFNPDQQCRLIWGPSSYLCRGYEFGNASTICTAMYCRDPSTENDCVLHSAARGTSCGNKKWCSAGKCVASALAPANNGTCLLGDQPGIAFIGKTCDQLVNEVPAYCYQEKVRARCCGSCGKYFTWRKGCEYGDRVKGCQTWHCDMIGTETSIQTDCCGTCNIGEKITTTPPPTFITTAHPPKSTIRTSCSQNADIEDKSCEDFIFTNGRHLCYDDVIESLCCQTCFKLRVYEHQECIYGDRMPSMCLNSKNRTLAWCEANRMDCCDTCVGLIAGSSKLSWNIGLTALVLTFLVFI